MSEEENNLIVKVLKLIDTHGSISTLELARQLCIDHQRIIGAIKSIESQTAANLGENEEFIKTEPKELKQLELTQEGKLVAQFGSHEARLFKFVPVKQDSTGLSQDELLEKFGQSTGDLSKQKELMAIGRIGFAKAMSNGWIQMDKETKKITRKIEHIDDKLHRLTAYLASQNEPATSTCDTNTRTELDKELEMLKNEMKKRKLIVDSVVKFLIISKGEKFSLKIEYPETDLTVQLLQSGEWRQKQFKPYNYNSLGVTCLRGHLHPLLRVREQFRSIFLEMGFTEMPTNNFVESSFWNFDILFVPQAHPARDSQDTFFTKHPGSCVQDAIDKELVERVRQAHRGSGSRAWPRGYQYEWNEQESQRNVLRTHTTAVTARMLYKLAQEHQKEIKQNPGSNLRFKAAKLFSIDRVFRNETLDATHLAEFNQVEGVIVDVGLTLGDLMGTLRRFFNKLGLDNLRFKPAYNPYTEPSMEVFSYHGGLKKWVEVGNSGVFRPEMLQALGLPSNVTAIAWGLSLERPTMIKYKIDNIRHLVGHKIDLQMVHNSPICIF